MNKQGIVKRSRVTGTIKRLASLLNAAALAVALASPGASIALAAQIKGPASRVVDGNTLWICSHSACTKVRL